jgi:hypothetical protein
MRIITTLLAALAFVAGCGAPDPDDTGRITGMLTDGGQVTGCSVGQVGRTLTFYISGPQGHVLWASTRHTWCCPIGSTTEQCPGRSMPAAECTGAWPGPVCPSPMPQQVGKSCASNMDCPSGLTCREENGRHFCSMECNPDTDGGPDPCGLAGGTCLPTRSGAGWTCYPRCVLPALSGDAGANRFATCSLGICAQMPTDPTQTQRGVCYPVSERPTP